MITDAGKNLIAEALRDGTQITIRYVALGSGTTAPAASDTQLEAEKFRKQVTKQIANGTGDTQTICYIAPYEANNFTIQEVGVFAGIGATETANSGVLRRTLVQMAVQQAKNRPRINQCDAR